MCGIGIFATRKDAEHSDSLEESLRSRGPDHFERVQVCFNGWKISLASAVLHIRGVSMGKQPLTSERFVFGWNGEVYAGIDIGDACDTLTVFNSLTCLAILPDPEMQMKRFFESIEAPFAFFLFDASA